MINELEQIINNKIESYKQIRMQGIARLLLTKKNPGENIPKREIWVLTKRLSTNKKFREYIEKSKERWEESKKKKISDIVYQLKKNDEPITVLRIRTLTGLPKNFLYSEEIESYIKSLM